MSMAHRLPVIEEFFAVFEKDVREEPAMTLRGGNALDDGRTPMKFDPDLDEVSEAYLNKHSWGIGYLDAASWRHYLPSLFEYALSSSGAGSLAASGLLQSLRPPDRDPPRLATLNAQQEAAVVQALESIAFGPDSPDAEDACQVLDEWWLPNARYRPPAT